MTGITVYLREMMTIPAVLWAGGVLHILMFLAVVLHCLTHKREACSALVWMSAAWSFPFFGPLAYAAFGVSRVRRKSWTKPKSDSKFKSEKEAREGDSQPLAYWRGLRTAVRTRPCCMETFNAVLDRITPEHPLLSGNTVELLHDGTEAFPAMLQAIKKARHHVHVMSFIIGADSIGKSILDACADAARRGVKVRILYDEFGSASAMFRMFFRKYRKIPGMRVMAFTQANILKRQVQVNLRNHRKIAIVDGVRAFTGGVNLHEGHIAVNGRPPIRDYHFAVSGPLVHELQYTFLRDWYYMTDESPDEILGKAYFPDIRPAPNGISARVANCGPTYSGRTVEDVFYAAMTEAEHDIDIVTPYFVPTEPLSFAMRMAALRGVRVRLVLPAANNHFYVKYAARAEYAELLLAGVRIFERRGPLVHAKAMVVDGSLSIFGSANFDVRSLRLNYETDVVSYDAALAGRILMEFAVEIENSDEIDLNIWQRRSRWCRLLENACSLMTPVL